jgi:hypothetical protein
VFDRKWKLIGLHQAGIDEKLMRSGIGGCPAGPAGMSPTGISLRTIVEAIAATSAARPSGTSIGSQERRSPPPTPDRSDQ